MTNDPFTNPQSSQFKCEDYNGRLLLIAPTEYLPMVKTTFGEKDAVDARITVIDEKAPGSSEEFNSARLFGGQLISATKGSVNKGMILARLGQGTAKAGQKPPWVLADPTEDDKVAARAYLASKAPQL
jgi:hypothetical protein